MSTPNQQQTPIPPSPKAFRWVVGGACVVMAASAIYVANLADRMNRRAERLDPLLALLESPDKSAGLSASHKAATEPLPPPTFSSLAILPIVCDSTEADDAAKRVPAALDESLRKHTRFLVIDREKVADALTRLGEKDRTDPVKVGRALQVDAVLKGRFHVFVVLQGWKAELIDVRTGLPVWARDYSFKTLFHN